MKTMDTIEHFSDFLRRIGAPNFLAIGIAVIVLWLLISGFVKGLRRRGRNQESKDHDEPTGEK
jgi:Na+/H+ antiporter NhaD/arsenite permease-like protein